MRGSSPRMTAKCIKSTGNSCNRTLWAFLSAPPGPEQDCEDNRPNETPADPRDVWVSGLPFEDLLMDDHWCNAPCLAAHSRRLALITVPYSRSTIITLHSALDRFSNECDGIAACTTSLPALRVL